MSLLRKRDDEHFELAGEVHRRGDPDCSLGWCAGGQYGCFPQPCEQAECKGLMHATLLNGEEAYGIHVECERCGAIWGTNG